MLCNRVLTILEGVFWPDEVELETFNKNPFDDMSHAGTTSSQDFLMCEQPAQEEDQDHVTEWLDFFKKSAESDTSALTCTKPVDNQDDELYSCLQKVIEGNTDIQLKQVNLERQEVEAKKQKMQHQKELMRIQVERKRIEKAKEQAKLQQQSGKSTT